MKKGLEIADLLQKVSEMESKKKDFTVKTSKMKLTPESKLNIDDKLEIGVTNFAHSQIASRLKIPKVYYDRMLLEQPALLADNVNVWLSSQDDRRLIRTIDNNARAFLSDRYRILDNGAAVKTLLTSLSSMKIPVNFASSEVLDDRMYIKATFPSLRTEIKRSALVGDILEAGLVLSNSEVGAGSLLVSPFTNRLWCANGAYRNSLVKKYHVGSSTGGFDDVQHLLNDDTKQQNDAAFWGSVGDIIKNTASMDILQGIADTYGDATERKITQDTFKVVEQVAKAYNFSELESRSILENLLKNNDLSQFGLGNAVTQCGNTCDDYSQSDNFQRVGGKILELDASQWQKIA